jgi:hypothetical protein
MIFLNFEIKIIVAITGSTFCRSILLGTITSLYSHSSCNLHHISGARFYSPPETYLMSANASNHPDMVCSWLFIYDNSLNQNTQL